MSHIIIFNTFDADVNTCQHIVEHDHYLINSFFFHTIFENMTIVEKTRFHTKEVSNFFLQLTEFKLLDMFQHSRPTFFLIK